MEGEEVKRAPPASAAQSGQVVDWPTRGVEEGEGGGEGLEKGALCQSQIWQCS